MQIKIKIEKKHVYFLTAIILAVIGVSYVIAYGGTSPATVGHSAGELDLTPLSIDTVNSRVGIGTTSPGYPLEIKAGTVSAFLQPVASTEFRFGSASTHPLTIYSGGTERMRIDTSGNVGIGTTNPQTTLHLERSSGAVGIRMKNDWQAWDIVTANGNLFFKRNEGATTEMTLAEGGKLGVGTTGPTYHLDVRHGFTKTDTTWRDVFRLGSNDAANSLTLQFVMLGASTQSDRKAMIQVAEEGVANTGTLSLQPNGGSVGIGTTNPASKLDVNGQITASSYAAPGTGYMQFYVDSSADGYRFRKGTTASSTDLVQVLNSGDVGILGSLSVGGGKNFVQDHPTDPIKEIVYTSIESGEVRTLLTGSAELKNGEAVISLPEHFSLVTNNEGLTAVATPTQESNGLYVSYKDNKKLIVKEINNERSDTTFDYIITGIRTDYEDKEIIRDKD